MFQTRGRAAYGSEVRTEHAVSIVDWQPLHQSFQTNLFQQRLWNGTRHDILAQDFIVKEIRFLEIVLELDERVREVVTDESVGSTRSRVLLPNCVELSGRVSRNDLLNVAGVICSS